MTVDVKKQRKRAVNAIAKRMEELSDDPISKHDYLLDDCVRVLLGIPDRPIDNEPYVGWQVNRQNSTFGFNAELFADFCRKEAAKNLTWTPNSEAVKYTKPFEAVGFRGRFAWCAAFVRWCLLQVAVKVPLTCDAFPGYTYALCESFQKMAQSQEWYFDNDGDFVPRAGDIVLFDWGQRNINEHDADWEDHIGVYLEPIDRNFFLCAEGNSRNQSGMFKRYYLSVQGYIRIPEGTTAI